MKKLLTLLILCAASCSPLPAQNTLAGNLTVQQAVKFTSSASPAPLTANANDYAPSGFSTAAVLRIQSDVPRTITGLAGGAAGRMVWLTNVGSQTISLATESASSSAANRFAFGASGFDLPAGGSLSIWYDTASSRWRAATNLAAGGGGTTIDQTARDAAAAAQATADSKQAALANAGTLAKVTESAGLPLWDGAAWPGGGSGGTGTVTSVSVVSDNGVSGSVANASTTPAITLSLGAITPASVAATGTVTGSNLSGTNTGDQTSVSGNAGTATKLATARTINGVPFDGTAAITVPAAAGTLTGSTLASGVTASSLTSAAGGTFGTAAFTAASAYDPAGAAAAITLSGLGGVPTTRTVNGHSLSSSVTVTASDVGLGSVENTALSTWIGSSSLSTVGTITAGTWHGAALADTYIASASAWNAKVSFPGFGTTGTTAAVGNDARLSDARTPLAHNQAWSTITSTPTTLSGYGITDAQPLDSDLTSIAALSTTSYGRSLLTPADAAAARTLLGVSSGGVSSVAGRTGDVTLAQADISGLTTTSTPQFAGTTLSGDLSIVGSGRRIRADFSAASASSRTLFQSSVTNGATAMWLIPNGTSPNASIRMSNGQDPDNSGWSDFYTTTGTCGLRTAYNGTGASVPIVIQPAAATAATFATNGAIRFNAYGAGTLVTDSSGNVTASSDSSLKTVTGSFTRGLADVLKLTPRIYHWNEKSGMSTEDDNVGFIAQEVLEAIPEAVGQYRTTETEIDGKKTKKREKAELLTLSDRPLIATLVNAVRELNEKNAALEARVAALENGKASK